MLTNTKFKKTIKAPTPEMLKPGRNNKKLKGVIKKGAWKGLPIYSLTLEERASCPSNCEQWDNCYGNNMPFANRYDHTDPKFLKMLAVNLTVLEHKHPSGFVIRLHILGDFFSKAYVEFWEDRLETHTALRVWGYTHHRSESEIGRAVNKLNVSDKCAVRFSDDEDTTFSTTVAKDVGQAEIVRAKTGALICPEQTGKTKNCGTCSLCWASQKPIIFIEQ